MSIALTFQDGSEWNNLSGLNSSVYAGLKKCVLVFLSKSLLANIRLLVICIHPVTLVVYFVILISRRGFVYLELDNISGGVYNIRPCTFYPNQESPFFLTVKSSAPISISRMS